MSQANPPAMTSKRPYLLRAIREWIIDNGMTPYVVVDAAIEGVMVPPGAIKDGKVVLNLAQRAVSQLDLGNRDVRFMARFGGVSHAVHLPMGSILAIYAQESGEGMALPADGDNVAAEADDPPPPDGNTPTDSGPSRRGVHLRVVK